MVAERNDMLLRQIQYFQAIVETGSFTEAAEECHISQSAISQQIKAMEEELGFSLMVRKNRTLILTDAGRYFYEKSRDITRTVEKITAEARKIADGDSAVIRIGYLKNYGGHEFSQAVAEFSKKYPKVNMTIFAGTHEELCEKLITEQIDIAMSDQRRAFSENYNNLILAEQKGYIEVPENSFLASLEKVGVDELSDATCILVTAEGQEENDTEFYRDILGFKGSFLICHSLEEARMSVLSGKGYLPIEGEADMQYVPNLKRVPLYRGKKQVFRRYCAFWAEDNSGYYIEEFADILKKQFEKELR